MAKVFVFDPTTKDQLSRHRGVGRYLQILKENLPKDTIFTDSLKRIYADSVFINPFFNFLQPPLTIKRLAKKQICVIHDLIPLKYPQHFPIGVKGRLNVFLNKLALKNYDFIITDSYSSKKDIVQMLGVDEKKVKVVYPCLPKSFCQENQKSNQPISTNFNEFQRISTNFCLYVGDVTWNKNLVNLAKAIKIINITCVLVGKGFEKTQKNAENKEQRRKTQNKTTGVEVEGVPTARSRGVLFERAPAGGKPRQDPLLNHPWQKEFYRFLQEVENDKRFIFFGFVDDGNLIKLYQQAKVNILPSRAEGFGFSYLEAASQSCPSVLGDIPVLREIADGAAWFANPTDPYDLANKIGEIYFNNNLRNDLGEKAKKRAKFFSREKFKSQLLKLWT